MQVPARLCVETPFDGATTAAAEADVFISPGKGKQNILKSARMAHTRTNPSDSTHPCTHIICAESECEKRHFILSMNSCYCYYFTIRVYSECARFNLIRFWDFFSCYTNFPLCWSTLSSLPLFCYCLSPFQWQCAPMPPDLVIHAARRRRRTHIKAKCRAPFENFPPHWLY